MRNAIWILALAVGCHYNGSPANPGDDTPGDGSMDQTVGSEEVIPPDAQACFGTDPFVVCLAAQPNAAIDLSQLTVTDRNTDMSTQCLATVPTSWSAKQDDACIIVGTDLTVPASTIADFSGTRSLVLVATGTLAIHGTLELSATVSANRGPNSSPELAACNSSSGNGSGGKGGGGGGGSFGSKGADGGSANNMANLAGLAGAIEPAPHDVLHGGCRAGGGAQGGGNAAGGGHGGGAAFLVGATVTIDGVIAANGAGGILGDASKGGAGGGGAGGMIVIDGNSVTVTGTLVANGGGGGGGAEATNDGNAGEDPDPATPTAQADGGPKATGGPAGDGGKGAAAALPADPGTAPGNGDGGGGGGGGGLGVIRMLHGTIPATNVSPTPTQ